MRAEIARSAGFCYGVRRAVRLAREALKGDDAAYVLGQLIHNPQTNAQLAAEGLRTVDSVDAVPAGALLIIRSHGAPKAVYRQCEERGVRTLDATCPSVKRIHELVALHSRDGTPVVILGEREHPEVRGIAGWAQGEVYILRNASEAETLPPLDRALLVSQTTAPPADWEALRAALSRRVPALIADNTICDATARRQAEARALARRSDAMLVVGGKDSSNTRKLLRICSEDCARTLLVEGWEDIPAGFLRPDDSVGITAGASTPEWLLKEVVTRMDDMERQEQGLDQVQKDFMADIEATLVKIRPGQTVTGTVVQITDDEVCVNIGYKSDGLIQRADLTSEDCKVGDEIEVEVVKVNDGDGNVVLSQRNVVNRKSWEALMAKFEAGESVDGVGKEAVKGGLISDVMGIRAFIPASQLSQRYVEHIGDFVGKEFKLKIIEVDKSKKRIVASRKAYLQEEAATHKKEIWDKLHEGEVVHGIVRRLTDFGAFVDIGGVDGLIHVTDLSWGRVRHPADVVAPNQEVDVLLLSLDPQRERIQLGYKQLQKKPWEVAPEKYLVGSIVEGKVVRITTFGAFVELEPGLDGLVHISQCALRRIMKVEDAVQVGDIVRVKVLAVDPVAKRVSLSIREALEEEAFNYSAEIPGGDMIDNYDENRPVASAQTEEPEAEQVYDEPASEPAAEVAPEVAVEPAAEVAPEVASEPAAEVAPEVAVEPAAEIEPEPAVAAEAVAEPAVETLDAPAQSAIAEE